EEEIVARSPSYDFMDALALAQFLVALHAIILESAQLTANALELGQVGLRQPAHGQLDGVLLQHLAQIVKVLHRLGIDLTNEVATLGPALHQAVLDQPPQGLANRGATYLEPFTQISLRQLLTGPQLAGQNELLDPLVDAKFQCRLGHRSPPGRVAIG